jgi:hypothetical protein
MKYLTANQLNITEEERVALLKVKRYLKKLPTPEDVDSRYKHTLSEVVNEAPALFNMNRAIDRYDCGTACCIGGWVSIAMQGIPLRSKVAIPVNVANKATKYVGKAQWLARPIDQLFYPESGDLLTYDSIIPTRVVEEIETFLKTGRATW